MFTRIYLENEYKGDIKVPNTVWLCSRKIDALTKYKIKTHVHMLL